MVRIYDSSRNDSGISIYDIDMDLISKYIDSHNKVPDTIIIISSARFRKYRYSRTQRIYTQIDSGSMSNRAFSKTKDVTVIRVKNDR